MKPKSHTPQHQTIPELPDKIRSFVRFTPVPGSLTSDNKLAAERACRALQDLRKRFQSDIKRPKYALPELPPWRLSRLPSRILFVYVYGRDFVKRLARDYSLAFEALAWVSQMQSFLKACVKQAFDVTCDVKGFINWVIAVLVEQRFGERKKQAAVICAWLNNKLARFLEFETDALYVQQMCQVLEDTVVPGERWCPVNDLDLDMSVYFQGNNMTTELYRIVQCVTNGDTGCFTEFAEKLVKQMQLKSPEQEVVLEVSLWRVVFDMYYISNPSLLMSTGDEQFATKCTFISSFSPRSLGLSEHLFTAQQMDTPMMNLVRENRQIREISEELASLQFFTCPNDILFALQKCVMMIDKLARSNELERKLGPFVGMLEEEQIRGKGVRFMSFDDIFSLFFSILAAEPPRNALAICDWLTSMPDSLVTSQRQHAKATFIGAVDHIMQFTEAQLVRLDEDVDDPLGISKKR